MTLIVRILFSKSVTVTCAGSLGKPSLGHSSYISTGLSSVVGWVAIIGTEVGVGGESVGVTVGWRVATGGVEVGVGDESVGLAFWGPVQPASAMAIINKNCPQVEVLPELIFTLSFYCFRAIC